MLFSCSLPLLYLYLLVCFVHYSNELKYVDLSGGTVVKYC
jgi:hypothetical protein